MDERAAGAALGRPDARLAPRAFIRGDGNRAAVLLINASLDASQPCDLLLRGGMARARALQADGAQADLTAERERDGLCVRLPSIPPWQPLVNIV